MFEYARKIPTNSHALKLFYVATTDFPINLFKTQKKYTEEQRGFALTLHLYGPKAYEYLRKCVKLKLPASRTMQQ
mgnify:CR=1 FL=1